MRGPRTPRTVSFEKEQTESVHGRGLESSARSWVSRNSHPMLHISCQLQNGAGKSMKWTAEKVSVLLKIELCIVTYWGCCNVRGCLWQKLMKVNKPFKFLLKIALHFLCLGIPVSEPHSCISASGHWCHWLLISRDLVMSLCYSLFSLLERKLYMKTCLAQIFLLLLHPWRGSAFSAPLLLFLYYPSTSHGGGGIDMSKQSLKHRHIAEQHMLSQ